MSQTVRINVDMKASCLESIVKAFNKFEWYVKQSSLLNGFVAYNKDKFGSIHMTLDPVLDSVKMTYDSDYSSSIQQTFGQSLDRLKQEYTCQVVEADINAQGGYVTRSVDAENNVFLEAYVS